MHLEGLVDEPNAVGIDIGTGCSCIYAMLGVARNPHWKFLALDIDPLAVEFATGNVKRNNLQNSIEVKLSSGKSMFPPELHDDKNDTVYHFSMCNPPFYIDGAQIADQREAKELEPSAVCTGSEGEMITPGGEVEFVSKMIEESMAIGKKVRYYTSLIGRKQDFLELQHLLDHNVFGILSQKINHTYFETRLGHTVRWILCWNFL
jgi:23S rRNA A1618 N6-methylase RlmF